MFDIGPLEFFPPQPLRSFSSLGSNRLYALVAVDDIRSFPVVYIGKSIELAGGGIDKRHHAVARWRCLGEKRESLLVCESSLEYDDAELAANEARLIAMLSPELNEERAANEPTPWWRDFFRFSHHRPEGTR